MGDQLLLLYGTVQINVVVVVIVDVIAFTGPAQLIKPTRVQNRARFGFPRFIASAINRAGLPHVIPKVISAHQSSPANRASLAHVIRPIDSLRKHKHMEWSACEYTST